MTTIKQINPLDMTDWQNSKHYGPLNPDGSPQSRNPYTTQIHIGPSDTELLKRISVLEKENEQLKKFISIFGPTIRYVNSVSQEDRQKHPWKLFFKTYEHTIKAIETCVSDMSSEFVQVRLVGDTLYNMKRKQEFDSLQESLAVLEEAGLIKIIE